ncbi:MAG TPA: helix-turn-helix transcriptional regulator, partial [Candidatus Sumerlaeota bacterium]|nr:helix-turn-helix transcriptional regulator [Candidatus Sumerlaeota bacterium]
MRFARFILPILLCLAMQVAFAEEAVIAVRSGTTMDEIGQSLRRAVNAYEEAQQNPVPQTWTRLSLMEGENKRLGDDLFVALLPATAAGARVTVVDAGGPHEGTFKELGWYEKDLGSELGLSQSQVSKLINNKEKNLSIQQILALAK